MKYLESILFVITVNICLTASIIAQSEQGYVLGMKNFEKSFSSENTDWDSYENLYIDTHWGGQLKHMILLEKNWFISTEILMFTLL